MDDTRERKQDIGMNLDRVWGWGQKKLNCRMKIETGNPSGDALRDDLHKKLAELANVNLQDLLADMKKKKTPNVEKQLKEIRKTTFILGSAKSWDESHKKDLILSMDKNSRSFVDQKEDSTLLSASKDMTMGQSTSLRNLKNAKYFSVPKSPPRRILLELTRERAKPPIQLEQFEISEQQSKLEVKVPKKRLPRMNAIDIANKLEKSNSLEGSKVTISKLNVNDYNGDKFSNRGSYLDGMLYLSRMEDSPSKRDGGKRIGSMLLNMTRDSRGNSFKLDINDPALSDLKLIKSLSIDEGDDSSEMSEVSTKLYCAACLCNWARIPSNAQQLANEGAVRAVMQLCNEADSRILKFCAAAFRYMSDSSILSTQMIDENSISVMSELVNNANSEFVSGSIVVALVNLTRVGGKEEKLVESGIILAIQTEIQVRPDLNAACARALYNLTCVDSQYNTMERVIRMLVTLSTTSATSVKHICAAALCNLADIKNARLRMVEEGVVSVLSSLARGSETKTRRVCAVVLQNLSATKACRVEMVSRNCVQVAYGLSSDQDPIVLRCIGITLARLAQEEANCARMINEGGISALCNIAIKYPIVPGISQTVASALQLISSHTKLQFSLVSEGSVTAIASLLRLSTDIITLQQSLLALCNVLSSKDTHLSIVQQGMLNTLMALSEHENELMRSLCTLAFLNLSTNEDSYKHIINSGAISALITLSNESAPVIRRRCSATLCNVSNYDAGIQRMISDDIIPALMRLLETRDIETVRNVCAAFCRLCNTVENGKLVLESGAIPYVIQGAISGDVITQQYCGSVLSALTAYDSCRVKLVDLGVMDALRVLSAQDDNTKQRCLVAFANLSCESSLHEVMISKGVISIIAKLVNSYQELNQICCATAICNLAYVGSRLRILTDGGLQALLMISMVRSVNNHTKMLCVVALGNLFEESTMEFLLNEGLVGAVANLCKVPDDDIGHLSAKMFNQFSLTAKGRLKLIEKSNVIVTLFQLIYSDIKETRIICAHTTSNLVMAESEVRQKCVKFGALAALSRGMDSDVTDDKASLHCVKAINAIGLIIQFRWIIAKTKIPETIIHIAMMSSGEKYERCCKIICMLAWASGTRFMLQNAEIMNNIMQLVKTNMQQNSVRWIALTFRYLTFLYYDHYELINMGMFQVIQKLLTFAKSEDGVELEIYIAVACIFRSMLETAICIPYLANKKTVDILHTIVEHVNDSETTYNIAVCLYRTAEYSAECRINILDTKTFQILTKLILDAQCHSLVAAIISFYASDSKCVAMLCNSTIVGICAQIIDEPCTEDIQMHIISSLYCISKLPTGRVLLSGPPCHVDMKLMTLLKTCSPRMKTSCSRVLKNLSSDSSEDIEVGAVAALIALSFESKQSKLHEELVPPTITSTDATNFKPPKCTNENIPYDIYVEKHVVQKCGDVGKGPRPPDPPLIGFEGAKDVPNIMDEIDSSEASDGRTLMSFAKMQVPQNLRENYLLSDSDFELHGDEAPGDDEYSWDDEAQSAGSSVQQEVNSTTSGSTAGEKALSSLEHSGRQAPLAATSPAKPKSTAASAKVPSAREPLPLKEIASQHGLY